jgi:hypothetical protein
LHRAQRYHVLVVASVAHPTNDFTDRSGHSG